MKIKNVRPDLQRLKELLSYNPKTGIFTWKVSKKKAKVGGVAGCMQIAGYIIIGIDGLVFYAHRLAWYYTYGYWPENQIDHIDRNKSDNSIKNLREVSHACNIRNTGNIRTNSSGVRGVCFKKLTQTFYAGIKIDGLSYHLGSFADFDEAVCHRFAAEQCLGFCYENSPAFQYIQNKVLL